MPLDRRAQRFLDLLQVSRPAAIEGASIEQRRSGLAELMKFAGPAPTVMAVADRTVPGPGGPIPVRIYTGCGTGAGLTPGLIYFHGGGLVAGSVQTHDPIARALANAGSCRVISVDYRLAPEHRFPAALADATAATSYIAARASAFGIDPERLGICGDSAGGTLAAATCQALTLAGGAKLALQLLICPILDYSRSSASRQELARGFMLDEATLAHDLSHYLPAAADPADPRVSPLCAADLAGLPRTIMHTAEYDPLRDEGQAYADRLAREDALLSYTCHPGMIHLFYALGSVIPYAHTAFQHIGGGIRDALSVRSG